MSRYIFDSSNSSFNSIQHFFFFSQPAPDCPRQFFFKLPFNYMHGIFFSLNYSCSLRCFQWLLGINDIHDFVAIFVTETLYPHELWPKVVGKYCGKLCMNNMVYTHCRLDNLRTNTTVTFDCAGKRWSWWKTYLR